MATPKLGFPHIDAAKAHPILFSQIRGRATFFQSLQNAIDLLLTQA